MFVKGQTELPQLKILTLGPPQVLLNDNQVKITRREQRAGLYFLAGHLEPVSRIEICELFWPTESEQSARKKLREGLCRLRASLQLPDLIISSNDSISLDSNRIYVDYREFYSIINPILNSSEMSGSDKLSDWCYSKLRKAINLCRGTQFLQGINLPESTNLENWVSYTNLTYSITREKILQRLIDHCIAIGNLDEAILWLEMAIDNDPLNTENNFLMLTCLKEKGRIKEATDYISLLEKQYQSNLSEGLPQTIQDFKERLQANPPQKRHREQPDKWPVVEREQVPFVGCNDLIDRLNHAYHRKGIVHITGESGSGKTRLVQEFYSRLETKPRLLFWIGKPMISCSPFEPVIEGLKGSITEKEWYKLPEQTRIELKEVFLELSSVELTDNSSDFSEISHKPIERIYSALQLLFDFLSEKKPLLMVIDIAQWCDDATLGFLTFLNNQNYFKKHGLLVLISRMEEHNTTLDIFMDRGILANDLERILIQPFTIDETDQLVSMVLGQPVSGDLVTKIRSETGGNPFFIIETLRAFNLFDFDTAAFSKDDLYPVPATIISMVHEKIRLISPSAQVVLASAAVLGQRFFPEVLEVMMSKEKIDLVVALEELQAKNIVVGKNLQSSSYYEFPHDQIREVVLHEMSPARKRRLHLDAVKALMAIKGNAPELATTFGYHYELAGEVDKAFSSWCVAAKFARRRFSREDTSAAYQHAMDLLPRLPSAEYGPLACQLLMEWGDYAYDLYDNKTCEKLYTIGLENGEARQDPRLIGISLSGLGRVAEMRNEIEDGIELHNRALYFLTNANCKAEILETHARLGILYELKDDYRQAEREFLIGYTMEKDFSDERTLDAAVNIDTQLAILYCMMGKISQAESVADQAVNESRLMIRLSGRVHAYTALAMAQYYGGKYKKSLQNAFSVYKLAQQLDVDWWVSLLDLIVARDYLVMGQLDESWYHLHRAVDGKQQTLLQKILSHSHAIKGDIFRVLGDYGLAEEQYRLGTQRPITDHQTLDNYSMLGLLRCQNGKIQEGVAILKEAILIAEKLGLESISFFARLMLITWSMTDQDANHYKELIEPVINDMKTHGYSHGWLITEIVRGGLLLKQGKISHAKSVFHQVASDAHEISSCWNELWAWSALAGIKEQTKDERAVTYEKTIEILDQMSAHAVKRPVAQLFQEFRSNVERNIQL